MDPDTLSILHFNVRSVLSKISELQLLTNLHQPSIICIVEIWLYQEITDEELGIEGYQLIRLDRNRHGCGVLYVSNALTYKVLPSFHTSGAQAICPGVASPSSILPFYTKALNLSNGHDRTARLAVVALSVPQIFLFPSTPTFSLEWLEKYPF